VIKHLRSTALAVFIAGGLLSGTLGLNRLAGLTAAQTAAAPAPTLAPAAPTQPTPAATQALVPRPGAPTPAPRSAATPTPETEDPNRPSWLYVLDGNVWVAGGNTPQQLTGDGSVGQPALGDEGLAFVEHTRNASEVWLASSDGPPRLITRTSAPSASESHWASQPTFVPGRQRLFVVGDFNKASTGPGDLAVWEVGLDQAQPVQITSPPAYSGGDQDVTVNPLDARQIIFTRYAYVGEQLAEQLQWLDVSNDKLVALTSSDQSARQASFSPDAREVAFVQQGSGAQEDLYVAALDTSSGHAQLVDARQVATGMVANPVWTSDGNTLGYVALTANGFQLWSVDVERDASGAETFGTPRQLTSGPSIDATSRPIFVTLQQVDEIRQWLPAPPS
jgi:hypothetical protein